MRCPSCGQEAVGRNGFCEACGQPLAAAAPGASAGHAEPHPRRWRRLSLIALAVALIAAGVTGVLRYRSLRAAHGLAGSAATNASGQGGGALVAVSTVAAPCPDGGDIAGLETAAPGGNGAGELGGSAGGLLGGLAGGTAGEAPAESKGPAKCHALPADMENLFHALDSIAKTLPSDGYDESARASGLGDATAAFAFVRDRIRTQAYAGVMRGGVGTLMSRGGSPADKALLLGELLGTKNIAVRFVHTTLSDADVARVVNAIIAGPTLTFAHPALHMPADNFQKFTEGTNTAQPIADQIITSLTAAGAAFSKNDAQLRSRWSTNLRDHWWIQAQEGNDWVDLDPTLKGATPGSHLGPAPSTAPVDHLPDTLYAVLTFRITGDFVGPTGVTTDTMVEKHLHAADAYAQPIVVQVADPDASLANLGKSTSFTPSINVGGGTTAGNAFQPDPATGPRLLRMQLEIETDRPGYQPLIARRALLDRSAAAGATVDPKWDTQRTAFGLTIRADGLALAGDLDPSFAALREVEGAHAAHVFLLYAVNRPVFTLPQDAAQTFPLEAMHYLELDGMVRRGTEAQSPNHTRFYFDRPAIVFARRTLLKRRSGVVARHEFDVVEDAMDVTGDNATAAIRDNVLRGVMDNAIEAHVTIPTAVVTTRALLAAAPKAGVSIVSLLPATSAAQLPPVARAAASGSLQRGAIVATASPVSLAGERHVGWWEVDPATGSTIGRLESGAGQGLAEALPTTSVALKAVTLADVVGGFDRCMYAEVGGALMGGGGAEGAEGAEGGEGGGGGDQIEALGECGKKVLCDFALTEAIGDAGSLFDFENEELINQLLDLDNDLWGWAGKACEAAGV